MSEAMQEVEVKFLEVDVALITRKLLTLGAKKVFEGNVSAVYFEHPLGLIGPSEQLRLRKKGDLVELTYKKDREKGKAKICDETELKLDDYDSAYRLITSLGFKEKRSQEKRRVSYSLRSFLYEFDTLPGIPTLLEVEAQNLSSLEEAVSIIGLSMRDARPWSGRDVLDYYANKK